MMASSFKGIDMSLEDDVIALVSRKTGISSVKITPEKTFYQLGIDGDDAVELIAELCDRYQVPTNQIDLTEYIGPEGGFGVINHLFNAIIGDGGAAQKELRIGDLIKTAQDRRWFDQHKQSGKQIP
jgi:acyl carrier protein